LDFDRAAGGSAITLRGWLRSVGLRQIIKAPLADERLKEVAGGAFNWLLRLHRIRMARQEDDADLFLGLLGAKLFIMRPPESGRGEIWALSLIWWEILQERLTACCAPGWHAHGLSPSIPSRCNGRFGTLLTDMALARQKIPAQDSIMLSSDYG